MAQKAQQVDFLLSPVREPGSGLVVNDGRVFFYAPGTTSKVTVYQNRNKTIEAANPFTLGSDGTGSVFVDGVVDIVIKRAGAYPSDETMWTQIKTYPGLSYRSQTDPVERIFEYEGWTTLNEAIEAIGSTETTLLINSTVAQNGDVDCPVTCELKRTRKGYIDQGVHALTIRSPFNWKRTRAFLGTGPVTFAAGTVEAIYPEWWSATGGVKEAWDAAAGVSKVSLARKEYVDSVGISNTTRGGIIEGYVGERNNSEIKGSVVKYTGSGEWFENGTDNGLDWDVDGYDGPQMLTFKDFSLKYGGTTTALTNGAGNYGAGSYGIRDWRGGSIRMKGMHFENWDYAFWGVQSDINELDAIILYCEHGFFVGPRSDQLKLSKLYALYCTQALILDGCVAWVDNLILKECGHENKCPIEVRQNSTNNRQCHFGQVWVEDYGGGTASYVNAFFDVGISAGNNGASTGYVEVVIDEITYLDHVTPPKTKYLAQVGKGVCRINNPKGDFSNIDALIDFTGGYTNANAGGHVTGPSFLASKCFSNSGGGTPDMTHLLDGPGGFIFGSTSNKQFYRRLNSDGSVNAGKTFAIYSAVDNRIAIDLTEKSTSIDGSNDILRMDQRAYFGLRNYVDGTIADNPAEGTWEAERGDFFTYTGIFSAGVYTGPAPYQGKKCTTSGTQNTLNGGGTTGSITSGTAILTVNSLTGIYVGCYLAITGVTGAKKVLSFNTTTKAVTLDSNANATVAGAAVAYSPAKFKLYGALAGAEV